LNNRSIHYFRIAGACLTLFALFTVFTACAAGVSEVAGTSDISAPPSDPGATPSAPPEETAGPDETPSGPFSDEQIKDIYEAKNYSVLEIRDAGDYTMVHYINPEDIAFLTSRFEWFDRKTGAREFVGGFFYTDKFEITADKTLTVLTTGVPSDGYQLFPRFLRFGYSDVGGVVHATFSDSEYYMPLEQSFTLGIDRPECLKSVCYDGSSMLLTFAERPGYELEFHTDVEAVPKMTATYKDGVSSITLFNTILSDDFVQTAGKLLGSDPSPVTVTCDGINTVVTFKLREDAGRYTIDCFTTPVERVPHAVITYEADNFGYPKGW
jgi:hypothetical protein